MLTTAPSQAPPGPQEARPLPECAVISRLLSAGPRLWGTKMMDETRP